MTKLRKFEIGWCPWYSFSITLSLLMVNWESSTFTMTKQSTGLGKTNKKLKLNIDTSKTSQHVILGRQWIPSKTNNWSCKCAWHARMCYLTIMAISCWKYLSANATNTLWAPILSQQHQSSNFHSSQPMILSKISKITH